MSYSPIPLKQPEDSRVVLPARIAVSLKVCAVLAVANIICVATFSWAWIHAHAEPKTIAVTGSARKEIRSDLIVWTARVSASNLNFQSAYEELKSSMDKTRAYLKAHQIADSELTVGSVQTIKHLVRESSDKVSSYELVQEVQIASPDVEKVSDVARTVTDLLKEGVFLESEAPEFRYTKMADLKITMLAEATRDAAARAQQIAVNSGAKLGSIVDAKMGVMQINALYSDDVSDQGVNDTTSRDKEITAVVTAHFALE